MSAIIAEDTTQTELSLADTYLIENADGAIRKVVYRKHLLDTQWWNESFYPVLERYTEQALKNRTTFRCFVAEAESAGYKIYQLTQL